MNTKSPLIIWFRQDLRLRDNPALYAACAQNRPLIPVFIQDTVNAGSWDLGAASHVWLHHSLKALSGQLDHHLHIFKGDPATILHEIINTTGATDVLWNRCYEPWQIARDKDIKTTLKKQGISVHSFKANLLWEPWEIKNQSGAPYKVFTPYFRKGCLPQAVCEEPLPAPDNITFYSGKIPNDCPLEDLHLLPTIKWDLPMLDHWEIGEAGAQKRFRDFLENGLTGYKEGRDFPAKDSVSRLSPHLHFGEISPRQLWHDAHLVAHTMNVPTTDLDHFCSELGWREFSHHLLYHFPDLPRANFQKKFDTFPWRNVPTEELTRWQQGQTGYPIVDAAMRELWQTGYMHNRCRMIVGSFLVKQMLGHWHLGEDWFWDCLFDADLANNSASWQWIAGCGADAAPYFRIFNPITQGEKFDPDGTYIRRYVPELKDLPTKYLFAPWDAPESALKKSGVILGQTYPHPLVDHSAARARALEAFESLKNTA